MQEFNYRKWGKSIDSVMEAPVQKVRDLIGRRNNVINLSQGLPWFDPPEEAIMKTIERIKEGEANRYGSDEGSYELRYLILQYLLEKGIQAEVSNIVITPGSNQAFFITLSVIADKGDEIIIAKPYYFNHKMAAQILGVNTLEVEVDEFYHIDPAKIEDRITKRTRAIVVISPNNPTGSIADKCIFDRLMQICLGAGIYLITDEAYADFCWDKPYFSPLIYNESNTLGLFSFSKSFGMSGWRLGFIKCRSELVPQIIKAADTMHICPPIASQILAEEALKSFPNYSRYYRESIKSSRDILIKNLIPLYEEKLISKPMSEGGYYIFLKLDMKGNLSGWELTKLLIDGFNIAVMPGEAFGVNDGNIYLRLSYGNVKAEQMSYYAERLVDALYKINKMISVF